MWLGSIGFELSYPVIFGEVVQAMLSHAPLALTVIVNDPAPVGMVAFFVYQTSALTATCVDVGLRLLVFQPELAFADQYFCHVLP